MFFKGAGWLLKGHNGNALNELADTVVRGVEVDLDMYAHINPNVSFENAELQQQIYLHMYVRALVCMCEHLLFSVFTFLWRFGDAMCRPMVRTAIITQ